jgi:hypothetical protein
MLALRCGESTGDYRRREREARMIAMTFRINGREVALKDAGGDPGTATYLIDINTRVQRRVGRVWCAEHRKAPWVLASGPSANRLKLSVQGCCQKVIHQAKEALSQA